MYRRIIIIIVIATFIVILASCDRLSTGSTSAATTGLVTTTTNDATTTNAGSTDMTAATTNTADTTTNATVTTTNATGTTTDATTTVAIITTTTFSMPTRIVTFVTNCGTVISDLEVVSGGTIVLPVVEKAGYVLLGWYSSSDYAGTEFTSQTPVQSDITLYAKWSDTKIADGFSTLTAYPISMGDIVTCDIGVYDQRIFYEFVPTVSATYDIVSSGVFNPFCWLYDSESVEIGSADGGGSGENFLLSAYLEAGHTYYIEVSLLFDEAKIGVFTISINPQPN